MLQTLLLVAAIHLTEGAHYVEDVAIQRQKFEAFKVEFQREYKNADEENLRFNNFVTNLKIIDAQQAKEDAAGGSATHGVTKFMDENMV
jgi:hypothetical protein